MFDFRCDWRQRIAPVSFSRCQQWIQEYAASQAQAGSVLNQIAQQVFVSQHVFSRFSFILTGIDDCGSAARYFIGSNEKH
jgi:hypothetical protein